MNYTYILSINSNTCIGTLTTAAVPACMGAGILSGVLGSAGLTSGSNFTYKEHFLKSVSLLCKRESKLIIQGYSKLWVKKGATDHTFACWFFFTKTKQQYWVSFTLRHNQEVILYTPNTKNLCHFGVRIHAYFCITEQFFQVLFLSCEAMRSYGTQTSTQLRHLLI